MGQALFWSSLAFSLSVSLIAAYPENVILIYLGVRDHHRKKPGPRRSAIVPVFDNIIKGE
jgi:hypothetical protein